jgi:hypothetical protein
MQYKQGLLAKYTVIADFTLIGFTIFHLLITHSAKINRCNSFECASSGTLTANEKLGSNDFSVQIKQKTLVYVTTLNV